jgi:radical SAM superfamily enzyme YgiQ (UPF0313 family)
MKILLVNPPYKIDLGNGRERYYVRAGSRWPFSMVKRKTQKPDSYMPFPFYLAYAAALLEREGFEVEVIDGVALDIELPAFLDLVEKSKPEIIVCETATSTIGYDAQVAATMKERTAARIVFTGPHATARPEEVLGDYPQVDYLIRGEYEFRLLKLIRRLQEKRTLENLNGVGFRKNDSFFINDYVGLISNLDDLPMPAWHLFPARDRNDLSVYWDNMCQIKPTAQLHASRGCPFHCNFCLWNQVMYREGKYRVFSAKRVVDEIEFLQKNYRVRSVYFDDDTFTVSKKHVFSIGEEMEKRGVRIKWSCMGDAMAASEDMLHRMAETGCIGMKFGVESGDPEVLKGIGKPLDLDKVRKVARLCAKLGIRSHATFTFGLLGETRQSLRKTLEFAKSLDVDTLQFSITTPFPGTRYFEQVQSKGLLRSTEWQDYDGLGQCVVEFENLSYEEVEEFCEAFAGRWLRHKVKQVRWVMRQTRYLGRVLYGQGLPGLMRMGRYAWHYLRY